MKKCYIHEQAMRAVSYKKSRIKIEATRAELSPLVVFFWVSSKTAKITVFEAKIQDFFVGNQSNDNQW